MSGLQEIYIRVTNTLNAQIKVSLLGGTFDPMATSSNAKTKYTWDLTFEGFGGDSSKVQIEYRPVGSTGPYSVATASLKQQNFQGAIDALDTLGLGFFFQDGVFLVTTNDTYEFNTFSVI